MNNFKETQVTATINDEKTYIDINPTDNFSANTDITVTIDDSTVKNENNRLLSGTSVTFTTGTETNIANINKSKITVTPNITDDFITISGVTTGKFTIYNVSGKQVLSQRIKSDNEKFNIQNLKSGVYFVRIINNNQIFTRKFVKI